MPDILANVTMAHEIKATGITSQTWQRWEEVKGMVGGDTNAKAMTSIVNLIYLLYCSSRWADMQRKAAHLITAQWADRSKKIIPMGASEVKEIRLKAGGVSVFTHGQGEPYFISSQEWEQGQ